MKARILESYHVTHTAKELADELKKTPLYIRQIACALRRKGYEIPKCMNPVGTVKYSTQRAHFVIKTAEKWKYCPKRLLQH